MSKKWQETKLVDLLQVDLPRHMKSDEGLFLKVYQTGSIWAKNVVIYNDDRRVELGTTTRDPRDTRTPDLAITIPWPCLISSPVQNETKSREPAHTTDKLLRLSEKGNTCPSWLSAREVYART